MSGHVVPLKFMDAIGIGNLEVRVRQIVKNLRSLRLNRQEVVCLKYIVLLSPGLHCHSSIWL